MAEPSPRDIALPVAMIIRMSPDRWLTPQFIWKELQRLAPEVAEQVQQKTASYKDPERNSPVWFITNTFHHLEKSDEFELSDTDRVPVMRHPDVWLIIRKREPK